MTSIRKKSAAFAFTVNNFLIVSFVLWSILDFSFPHNRSTLLLYSVEAKEIIATYEWQKIGPNDTIPAGLEIRMDLDKGGKWARLPPPEEEEEDAQHLDENGLEQHQQQQQQHHDRCGPSCKERMARLRAGLRGRRITGDAEHHFSWFQAAAATATNQGEYNFGFLFLRFMFLVIFIIVALGFGVISTGKIRRTWRRRTHES